MNRRTLFLVATLTAANLLLAKRVSAEDSWPLSTAGERASVTSGSVQQASALTDCGCGSRCSCSKLAGGGGPGWPLLRAGADFLFIRPHFSEAIAFANGTQSPTSLDFVDSELEFDYDASLRAFVAYGMADGRGEIGFTYWRLEGDVNVSGVDNGPGTFIIDPFGNVVGTYTVIDPADRRYLTNVTGGDAIQTRATVDTNVYDIYCARSLWPAGAPWDIHWSAGARIADIDQFYSSTITDSVGNVVSQGSFTTNFVGAGPRAGGGIRRWFGPDQNCSLFLNSHGSLLVGQYDVQFSNAPMPVFTASQTERLTRLIPVFETELGLTCQLVSNFSVSAGWLFQAWFDQGASGGKFAGLFTGADDSNIMSFDGLTVRGELTF